MLMPPPPPRIKALALACTLARMLRDRQFNHGILASIADRGQTDRFTVGADFHRAMVATAPREKLLAAL